MPKLILSLDDTFLGEFPLEKKYVTIGRRPTNDIQIDNLAVSGEHARVISVEGSIMLEDLESTNGSTLNGRPAKKHLLQHGDVIGIGRYQLTFVDERSVGVPNRHPQADFEHTILVQPQFMSQVLSAQSGTNSESALTSQFSQTDELPPAACVQVLNGPAKGKELHLSKTLTTLGKPGEQVAVISRRPHGYYITHVEGQEQPLVNGGAIGVQAHQLQDHDVIELAGVKMEFYLSGQ
jgi:pSer/pThr/pTyr-binding forkhead associated (FHA) protein